MRADASISPTSSSSVVRLHVAGRSALDKPRRRKDHNYTAPLPCTPPLSPLAPASPTGLTSGGRLDDTGSPTVAGIKEVIVTTTGADPAVGDDSVTRCICDFQHDDGYMICCDHCGVWQHVDCMEVDRKNIPDSYMCELCEPRLIDKHRAIQIQTRKRDDLSVLMMDSSATETDDETPDNPVHVGRRKKRQESGDPPGGVAKKRMKRNHKDESPKKKTLLKTRTIYCDTKASMSPQKPTLPRHRSFGGLSSDGFVIPVDGSLSDVGGTVPLTSTVPVTPTEALFAAVNCMTAYQDATCNCYTPELQGLLASIRFNGQHSNGPHWPPVLTCAELSSQLARHQPCRVASVTGGKTGLEATDDIITHQPLIEYIGNVMLRDQYDNGETSFENVQPYVLFYTKLNGLDLCIDSRAYGNEARFVRRSCNPNAEVRHVLDGGTVRFFIHATKSIVSGAEITIAFDFNYHKCKSYVECACTRMSCTVIRYQKQRDLNHLPSAAKRQRIARSVDSKPVAAAVAQHSPVDAGSTLSFSPSKALSSSSLTVSSVNRQKRPPPLHISGHTSALASDSSSHDSESKSTTPLTSPVKLSRTHASSAPSSVGVSGPESRGGAPTLSQTDTADETEKNKKKTREEKKLEAIVKAFERMEKREQHQRKKEAQQEQSKKPREKERTISGGAKSERDCSKSDVTTAVSQKLTKQHSVEWRVSSKDEVKSQTLAAKSKKGRHPSSSQRSSTSSVVVSSTSAAVTAVAGSATSSPVTSTVSYTAASTSINAGRMSPSPADDNSTSSCPTSASVTDKPLHYPKKLMMRGHEIRRHSSTADLRKPLSVQTDGPDSLDSTSDADSEYMTCVPSPHTFSLSSLRRDNLSAKGFAVLGSAASSDARGCAKKRWLQKAMCESTTSSSSVDRSVSVDSQSSAVNSHLLTASSSLSPLVTASVGPALSPTVDFVTPLKKRRLARESLSVDGSLRSISEEDDSPSARTASPPDALRPTDAGSAVSFTIEDRNASEHRCQEVRGGRTPSQLESDGKVEFDEKLNVALADRSIQQSSLRLGVLSADSVLSDRGATGVMSVRPTLSDTVNDVSVTRREDCNFKPTYSLADSDVSAAKASVNTETALMKSHELPALDSSRRMRWLSGASYTSSSTSGGEESPLRASTSKNCMVGTNEWFTSGHLPPQHSGQTSTPVNGWSDVASRHVVKDESDIGGRDNMSRFFDGVTNVGGLSSVHVDGIAGHKSAANAGVGFSSVASVEGMYPGTSHVHDNKSWLSSNASPENRWNSRLQIPEPFWAASRTPLFHAQTEAMPSPISSLQTTAGAVQAGNSLDGSCPPMSLNGSVGDATTNMRMTQNLSPSTPVSAPSSKKRVSLSEYRRRMSQRSGGESASMSTSSELSSAASVTSTSEQPLTGREHGGVPLCNGEKTAAESVTDSNTINLLGSQATTTTAAVSLSVGVIERLTPSFVADGCRSLPPRDAEVSRSYTSDTSQASSLPQLASEDVVARP